jgi:hypothetical protein
MGADGSVAGRRRVRVWLIALVVVVLLSCLVGAVIATRGTSRATSPPTTLATLDVDVAAGIAVDAGLADPRQGEMPAIDQGATAAYLEGNGAKLVAFVAVSGGLVTGTDLTAETCTAVAQQLDNLGTPRELYAAVAQVPDKESQGMFTSVVAGSLRVLGSCGSDQPPPTGELGFDLVVAQRQLQQLGVNS